MFLMDRFFDGAFLTFGLEVIAFAEQDQEDRLDPLIYVFPRMTKVITFHPLQLTQFIRYVSVHLSQVRNERRGGETRCSVSTAPEYC